ALALPGARLFGLALVMQLLAAGERQLDLGAALLVEIELERHDGHPLALDRAAELVDLTPVEEQSARALGGVIEAAGLQIFGNVGVDEPKVPAARVGVGLADRGLAGAQRLHLAAGERDASLEHFADLVVEARLAVVGDDAQLAVGFRRHGSIASAGALAVA